MFNYSLERCFFWVQFELCSSIRSEVTQTMLRHVKTKNCLEKDPQEMFCFFTRRVCKMLSSRHLGPKQGMFEQVVQKYNFWDSSSKTKTTHIARNLPETNVFCNLEFWPPPLLFLITSKRIKLETCSWSQMKRLFKSF